MYQLTDSGLIGILYIRVVQNCQRKIFMPKKEHICPEEFRWYHKEHGEVICTQRELYTRFKLDRRPINNVARGRKKSHLGWKIKR